MNANINWPSLPYFEVITQSSSKDLEPGLVVMNDGQKLLGNVIRLDPVASVLEFHPERSDTNMNIEFSNFKSLRLLDPVQIKPRQLPDLRPGLQASPPADKQKCTVNFKDGEQLVSETVGYVKSKSGLFLFLVQSG